MPTYAIQFWVSNSGKPNSFVPLSAVPETSDGNGNPAFVPVAYTHTPLVAGARWYYRARRVMYPDGIAAPVYSDFSPVLETVAPYPEILKGKDMDAIFGSSTILGIGIQPFGEPHDKPRKAQWIVENPSGRVRAELGTFGSRALKNTTARRTKTGAGRAAFPFNIPFEMTPNGAFPRALVLMFGAPTTTRVGGTAVTLTANAAQGATSLTVTALAGAVPSGSVLNFSVARTTTLTADAAQGAVTLAVAALPSAIPSSTPMNVGGVWFRTTASALAGATSLSVTAIPAALANGATLSYQQDRFVTTSAAAAQGATAVPVVATGFALNTGDSSLYGFKYRHEFTNTKRYHVGTFSQLVGDFVEVSPGAMANQLEFNVDYDMDTFITGTLQGNCLNQTRRYTMAQTGLDVALGDSALAFSMIDARLVVGGVESADAKSVTVSINRNGRAKGALRRKRGVSRHTPSITDINMTLNSFYTSADTFMQTYFGQNTVQTSEYGVTCRIITQQVSLEFLACPVGSDLSYEMGVIFPKASIETDTGNIGGPDEIMEDITLMPNRVSDYNGLGATDAVIYLVNDESLSDLMTPSAPITPVPVNAVTSYTSA